MKNNRKFKLVLDILIAIGLLTLYSKNFLGLFYHELAGLLVLIPILMHIIINVQIIGAMRKNFSKAPLNIKLCLIIDIILMVLFIFMGVSGVLISKTLLTGISLRLPILKTMHTKIAAMALVLLGIHTGLHLCRKEMKTAVAVVLTVVSLACAIYGVKNTSFRQWISQTPLSMSEAGKDHGEMPEGFTFSDEIHDEGDHAGKKGGGQGKGLGKGLAKGENEMPGHGSVEMSLAQKAEILAGFFGILFTPAMITYWTVTAKKKRNKRTELPKPAEQ